MPRHEDATVSFDVPRLWDDRTIVAYRAPTDGDAVAPNVVVTREQLPPDADFVTFADNQVDEVARQLDGFVLHGTRELQVDGLPAVAVGFTSEDQGELVAQRMTMVQLPGSRVITITMTAAQADLAQVAPLFERILGSFSFRRPEDSA